MDKKRLISVLENFRGKRIIVLGDIMLDKYIWGDVSRISPEAPVQVVRVGTESFSPGGAANVASNVSFLQAQAHMIGIVGNDEAGKTLVSELSQKNINTGGIIVKPESPTIQKTRIMARGQQLLRVDHEDLFRLEPETERRVIGFVEGLIEGIDAIIISDYAKGIVTKNIAESIIRMANEKGKITIIDPKPKNMAFYKNCTLITPNSKEAAEMISLDDDSEEGLIEGGKALMKTLCTSLIITRSEKGMTILEKSGEITNIPTKAKEVYNIVGAGDTVVATLALALSSGASLKESAILANYAAGVKVGKVKVPTVEISEIREAIEND